MRRRHAVTHACWLALARASFGLPAVAAPDACLRLLRLARPGEPTPGRFFVGFFGVREVLLAAFLLSARRDLSRLRWLVALGALADIGDSALLARELAQRDGIEPAAVLMLGSGLGGSAASIAVLRELLAA